MQALWQAGMAMLTWFIPLGFGNAAGSDVVAVANPAGGSVFLSTCETIITNTSEVAQQIESIMKPDSFTVRTPSGTPQCQVGTVLSAGEPAT
ncbi:hypothetical protein GO496_19835 [Acidovorax citrulli]|nr:hypothetical protein [Paracidovorax citrulli]MVT37887.1 hypothetical protein [Paracidovorax citrulli]